MTERDVDWQLVTRVQRGDKHAYELLVSKYQRRITRLLSRIIRDPSTSKTSRKRPLSRHIGHCRASGARVRFIRGFIELRSTRQKSFRRTGPPAPTRSSSDLEDAENLEDGWRFGRCNSDALLLSKQVGEAVTVRSSDCRRTCAPPSCCASSRV